MASEVDPSSTILEYMSDHSGYKCGYCKSNSTNFSHGMWAHRMTVGDYQDLIDRGWRRSGKYCYKPTMDKTCCPMYTIKCDALGLKLSKTQKKVLKRMHRYLSHGDMKKEPKDKSIDHENCSSPGGGQEFVEPKFKTKQDLSAVMVASSSVNNAKGDKEIDSTNSGEASSLKEEKEHPLSIVETPIKTTQNNEVNSSQSPKSSPKVLGPDPAKPPCRKSKQIRLERREAKLAKRRQEAESRGESVMEVEKPKSNNNTPKSLEEFLNEPMPDSPAHKLEVKLVRSHPVSEDFVRTLKLAHQTYQKYQINIHGDEQGRCSEAQYKRFLCNSPLELRLVRVNPPEASFRSNYNASYGIYRNYQLEIHHDTEIECSISAYQSFLVDGPLVPWCPRRGPPNGYGSFHHQYWLDGRLIAVGVLDVLPHCVSSVYLYYDPEFSFLSLGTYASLRELALTRELHRSAPALKWYYMGFYIYSCPKMRYKGNYTPSYLLCPETYIWVPLEKATPKLDISKYSRFNEEISAVDVNGNVDLDRIKIMYDHDLLLYKDYHILNPEDEDEVEEYASLVGAKSAYSMILFRS